MFWKHVLPAIFWAVIIAFLSGTPGETLPVIDFWDFISFDKAAHALVYGLLTYLLAVGFCKQTRFKTLRYNGRSFAFSSAVIYGAILEILQFFVFEGRSFEWEDILANAVGCIIGIIIFTFVFGDAIKNK